MWDGSPCIRRPLQEPLTPVRLRSEYALVECTLHITQKALSTHLEDENCMNDKPGPCDNGWGTTSFGG